MKQKKKIFGLVGRNIDYSFSAGYFNKKFTKKKLDNYIYKNFDIDDISQFKSVVSDTKNLKGLNVTIPYKEAILPLLDNVSKNAKIIGAVNTIAVGKKKLKGYNTDHYGFRKVLKPMLEAYHQKALILGTGGASKAVAFALRKLKIEYDFVSRTSTDVVFGYDDIDYNVFNEYQIIINTTPLGTFPNITECPDIDYTLFTEKHIAFDLVYNPEETTFLRKAKDNGAKIKNGEQMLVYQAEKAWEIWNKK
ncbi:shikimate dehydrogenase [Flavobacterium arcticum]|uniref:Shikimate dehydrogenase n=1 Tax=Flavobacterium arcticum TaxID=1784713 RepID=A0A345HEG0_9FLAO|nr:shikimate dehydrogenase [Flavobacterium arcticum]AXG74970.1 shikimate dehydrogenase [Flavobacterium arcticum]KAF2506522.1 shikimate dehydrogenase [Flavobacterium arcticum]